MRCSIKLTLVALLLLALAQSAFSGRDKGNAEDLPDTKTFRDISVGACTKVLPAQRFIYTHFTTFTKLLSNIDAVNPLLGNMLMAVIDNTMVCETPYIKKTIAGDESKSQPATWERRIITGKDWINVDTNEFFGENARKESELSAIFLREVFYGVFANQFENIISSHNSSTDEDRILKEVDRSIQQIIFAVSSDLELDEQSFSLIEDSLLYSGLDVISVLSQPNVEAFEVCWEPSKLRDCERILQRLPRNIIQDFIEFNDNGNIVEASSAEFIINIVKNGFGHAKTVFDMIDNNIQRDYFTREKLEIINYSMATYLKTISEVSLTSNSFTYKELFNVYSYFLLYFPETKLHLKGINFLELVKMKDLSLIDMYLNTLSDFDTEFTAAVKDFRDFVYGTSKKRTLRYFSQEEIHFFRDLALRLYNDKRNSTEDRRILSDDILYNLKANTLL